MPLPAPAKPKVFKPKELIQGESMLIYGPTGSGKTHFVGTAARDPVFGKTLLLAPDPGTLTLAFDPQIEQMIDVVPIAHMTELDTWYEWLRVENARTKEYQTLAIDDLSNLAELALQEILQGLHDDDSSKDLDKPDIDVWGRLGIVVRRNIRRFRNLPMTFVATALAVDHKDDKTGVNRILPSVPGRLKAELGAYFNIIGYLYTEVDKTSGAVSRKLRCQTDGVIQAKDRSRKLGTILDDPSLPKMLELLTGDGVQGAPVAQEPKINFKKPNIK